MNQTVSSSRGRNGLAFHLITPANHFAGQLPFLPGLEVVKLATPRRRPCQFGWYLLTMLPGGGTERPVGSGFENFLYVVDGTLDVRADSEAGTLGPGGFVYSPPGGSLEFRSTATEPVRLLWVKRHYDAIDEVPLAAARLGDASVLEPAATSVPGLSRLDLLPRQDPAYDFNMSILSFEPGVLFPKVEVHDEEHGLYMLRGRGIYHLDGLEFEVAEGDFIYMAPYCPQYFYPSDSEPSAYLLYKDTFRDGF